MALYHRDVHGAGGQFIDVNLIEPLARLIETATLAYSHKGVVQGRTGNRLDASAPRNAYRTADGRWIALSSASLNIVKRLYRAVERPDLAQDPEYVDPVRRQEHADEIDGIVADWVAAHPFTEVMDEFERAEVAAAPVYDAAQLLADEHMAARGTFVRVDDPDLGTMTVQAPVVRIGDHAGPHRLPGPGGRRGQRGRLRRTARLGRGAPGRVADRRHHLNAERRRNRATTPSPTIGAGHTGQQRAHVREGAHGGSRSRLPRPRGRLRAVDEGGGPHYRRRGADQPRLGCGRCAPCASTASTRPGVTATSSRWSPAPVTPST